MGFWQGDEAVPTFVNRTNDKELCCERELTQNKNNNNNNINLFLSVCKTCLLIKHNVTLLEKCGAV